MEACAVRHLEPNENLFLVIDGWMKKYNTSPRHLATNNTVESLVIDLGQQKQHLMKKDNVVALLKKWTKENEQIVIVTSFSILVFAASTILLKPSFLKNLETEISSFFSNREETLEASSQIELTSGVYYIDKNNTIVTIEGEKSAEISSTKEINSLFPRNELFESPIDQMIENYVQSKMKNIDELEKEEENFDSLPVVQSITIEEEEILASASVEIPIVITVHYGTEIIIPSSVRQTGLCRNYTPYSAFYGRWNRGSGQRALSEQWGEAGMPSSNGIATLNGRYLVAVSPIFGRVGDNIDIVLSDGQIIHAMIADSKGSDATSEWGHVMTPSGAVDIIEWEASGTKAEIDLGSWKNVTVAKIINLGREIITEQNPLYEVSEEVEVVKTEEQEYIELYSSVYGLNEEKIYQIISDMTDDFSNDLYLQHNIIEKATVGGKTISNNSKEMAILLCIRNIYYNPERYGVSSAEIKGLTSYQSGLSYADQIEYLSNLLGVDTSLNYAICQAACSFKSPMFVSKNNPTNIMINEVYATFPTVTAGFIEQTIELLEIQLEGKTPIESIGLRMNFSPDNPLSNWTSNVLEVYSYVSKNYDSIFSSNEKIELLDQKVYSLQ